VRTLEVEPSESRHFSHRKPPCKVILQAADRASFQRVASAKDFRTVLTCERLDCNFVEATSTAHKLRQEVVGTHVL